MSGGLVLGLGGTVDYEIEWEAEVFESLIEDYGITRGELDPHIPISTERDLVVSILGFISEGHGGECFVESVDVIESFSGRFERRITIGGTCVRAAIAAAIVGVESLVHLVCIDDNFRQRLPPGCRYVCSAEHDSTHPHLIVQFAGEAVIDSGDIQIRAGRPNRLIYVNDLPNRELRISPDLEPALDDAELFLVSGFNTIRDMKILEDRLETVATFSRRVPADSPIVYEDAGFHLPAIRTRVRDAMASLVDVFSMNEDEMQIHLDRSVALLDVAAMASALADLHRLIAAPVIVVHSQYWAVAHGAAADQYAAALLGGVTMAATRYRLGDGFTAFDYETTREMALNPRGAAFCDRLEALDTGRIACVPAYDLSVPKPTVIGLGDSFVGGLAAALAHAKPPGAVS